MNLNSLSYKYCRKEVLYDLSSFLVDFEEQEKIVDVDKKKYAYIDSAYYLGKNRLFSVFEIHHHHASDARVGLTKQAVEIMKSRSEFTQRAIFFFVPKNSNTFRISLVTFDWANNKPNNPRRYSFLVGENQKVHTAIKQLSNAVTTEDDLLKRFSIEVVNDEFYKKISEHFEDLLKTIKYPSVCEQSKQEEAKRNFSVRLIGRLIFCWFLKKKIRQDGSALIPEELLSSKIVNKYENYYYEILEPLFFETLNKQPQDRIQKCQAGLFARIPFLNGGLFEAHDPEDGYKYDKNTEMRFLGIKLEIPNDWFIKFFETLETYSFTIDENTSTDIDLAVDPEMLGRIFENLLASINPETKESVRKATGSYYTPREIVDYMVTQSLKQYLYTKTDVDHIIIDSLFDFEPQVDEKKLPLTKKQEIYTALEEIKVLDPAVGSGAFPMGVLQKIMSIIHVIDPTGDVYRSLPTSNININQNLTTKKLDYANKLTIIQKCIYGVDIQPMAIEICRLRFFLTLIVEEESDNPQPLPNLNFNFACANTLIPLDNNNVLEIKQNIQSKTEEIEKKSSHLLKGKNIWDFTKEEQEELKVIGKEIEKLKKERALLKKQLEKANVNSFLNGEDYIAQLRAHRKDFFTSSGERKEILKKKFTDTQLAMLEALQANDWGNEKVLKLQAWKPFDNVSTDWFDPLWMFDVEDGFDIVIANPPYIGQKGHKKIFEPMKTSSEFEKEMDYWYFFLHKAFVLLKNKGIVSFITPNYWVTSNGGKKLRKKIISSFDILEMINFNENNIFVAGVHTNILILRKGNTPNHKISCYVFNHKYSNDFINNKNKEMYFLVRQLDIYNNWSSFVNFLPEHILRITNKLVINSEKLCDDQSIGVATKGITAGKKVTNGICNINQGIITGKDRYIVRSQDINNGIFILTEKEIKELQLNDIEKKLVRNFYKNSDIKQYYIEGKNKHYLLYINNIENETELRQYKHVYAHIIKYKSILQDRSINGVLQSAYKKGKWWALTTDRPNIRFENVKIVCPQRSNINTFALSTKSFCSSADIYYISLNKLEYNEKYILAILNSRLIYFWLYWLGKRKGEILELYLEPLQYIPIKKANIETQRAFIKIVDKILAITQTDDYLSNTDKQNRVKAYQDEIDQMVYKLYGLTEEEIKIVEDSVSKK